jgi:two-component system nitrate/nitrite response regulator NarL
VETRLVSEGRAQEGVRPDQEPTETTDCAAALVRQLARASEVNGPRRVVSRPDGTREELLVDVQLDDARYTLTRTVIRKSAQQLSPREREIAALVARGLPNKAIGALLDISAWTVATHLRRVFVKLGVASRAAMVAALAGDAYPPEQP